MSKFMVDVERKVDTLEGRVQEVLALQRIQQGEKQEILQALNGIRSEVSSMRAQPPPPSSSSSAVAAASQSPTIMPPSSVGSAYSAGFKRYLVTLIATCWSCVLLADTAVLRQPRAAGRGRRRDRQANPG